MFDKLMIHLYTIVSVEGVAIFWKFKGLRHTKNPLTLLCIMFQNGQTHFKNLVAFGGRFLKCV